MRKPAVAELTQLPTSTAPHHVLHQRTCRWSTATKATLLFPLALAILLPFALLTAQAIAEPATRDLIASAPLTAFGALSGATVWLLMFGIPACRALGALGWSRNIDITTARVTALERGLFGERTWTEPLGNYAGLSHHIRTTLSGAHHELILVHPDADRCLVVKIAEMISQNELEDVAAALNVPALGEGAMHRRRRTGAATQADLLEQDRLQPLAA